MPAIKDIQQTFGADPRFLLVGLSCDEGAERSRGVRQGERADLDSGATRGKMLEGVVAETYLDPGDPSHVPDRSRRPRPGHEPPRAGTQGGCPKRLERPETVPHREVTAGLLDRGAEPTACSGGDRECPTRRHIPAARWGRDGAHVLQVADEQLDIAGGEAQGLGDVSFVAPEESKRAARAAKRLSRRQRDG